VKDQSRTTTGKFQKGASGNPSGRPLGSQNKSTLLYEQMLEGKAELLIAKLMEKAEQGDIRALTLCLDRIFPVRKERFINLDLKPVESPKDLPINFQKITTAVAGGRITPTEGESMSNMLTNCARVMQTVELDQRVAELEACQEEVRACKRESDRFVNGGLKQLKENGIT
jgi:hypothetical protein